MDNVNGMNGYQLFDLDFNQNKNNLIFSCDPVLSSNIHHNPPGGLKSHDRASYPFHAEQSHQINHNSYHTPPQLLDKSRNVPFIPQFESPFNANYRRLQHHQQSDPFNSFNTNGVNFISNNSCGATATKTNIMFNSSNNNDFTAKNKVNEPVTSTPLNLENPYPVNLNFNLNSKSLNHNITNDNYFDDDLFGDDQPVYESINPSVLPVRNKFPDSFNPRGTNNMSHKEKVNNWMNGIPIFIISSGNNNSSYNDVDDDDRDVWYNECYPANFPPSSTYSEELSFINSINDLLLDEEYSQLFNNHQNELFVDNDDIQEFQARKITKYTTKLYRMDSSEKIAYGELMMIQDNEQDSDQVSDIQYEDDKETSGNIEKYKELKPPKHAVISPKDFSGNGYGVSHKQHHQQLMAQHYHSHANEYNQLNNASASFLNFTKRATNGRKVSNSTINNYNSQFNINSDEVYKDIVEQISLDQKPTPTKPKTLYHNTKRPGSFDI